MAEADKKVDPQKTPAQRASEALAEAAVEAERLQLDEAGPDHHYVVNGQKVDANGKPFKRRAKDED